jgi:hypothetical protein
MLHLYTVTPPMHQPQWPEEPQPISYPWGKGLLAAATVAFCFILAVDVAYAAWLLWGACS